MRKQQQNFVLNLFGDLVPDPMKGRAFKGIVSSGKKIASTEVDFPLAGLRNAFSDEFVIPSEIERGTGKPYEKQYAERFRSGVESLRRFLEAEMKVRHVSLILPGPNGFLSSESLSMCYGSHFSQKALDLKTWIKGSDVPAKSDEISFYSEPVLRHEGGAVSFGYYAVTVVPFDLRQTNEYATLAETLWILIAFRAARGASLVNEGESVMTSSRCERVPDGMIVDVTPEGIEPSYLSRDGRIPNVGFIVSYVAMNR